MATTLSPLLRRLVRRPGFSLLTIVTFALGLASAAAIFTLVDGVVMRPLPYREPDGLVGVWFTAPGIGLPRIPQSDATYLLLHRESRAFAGLGVYDEDTVNFSAEGSPVRLASALVTPSLFGVLGVAPALGRTFREEEERPGAEPTVVLSDGLFRRRFAGDPAVVGRQVRIDGVERRVVGVMPPSFYFPDAHTELWLPLVVDPAKVQVGSFSYPGVARLAAGVSAPAAAAEVSRLLLRLPELYPDEGITAERLHDAGFSAVVHPLKEDAVGGAPQLLFLLLASVAVLLLIACANVANLFLVRAEGRGRELAVRSALGAGRAAITGEILAESLLLALAAAALALPLAAAAVGAVVALSPGNIPRLGEVALGGREVVVTVALALAAGVGVGLLPLLRGRRLDLGESLKEGGRAASDGRSRRRVRSLLVACQMALAVVLLAASGLLARTFFSLRHVDPGFRAGGVVALDVSIPRADYPTPEASLAFFREVLVRVRALPGVTAAGALDDRPLTEGDRTGIHFADFPLPEGAIPPILFVRNAAPGTFRALRIPLLAGRGFEEADLAAHRRVAVVSASVARRYGSPQAALGHRLGPGRVDAEQMLTIVGVVGDVREAGLANEPVETVYFPLLFPPYGDAPANAPRTLTLLVRTSLPSAGLAGPLRQAVWAVDRNVPVASLGPLSTVVDRATARASFAALLLLLGAGLALVLGAVGLYGVVAYAVSQRRREIGVRMALGARPGDVGRLVLGEGLTVAAAGIAVGLLAALGSSRLLASMLYGVTPRDPWTLSAVAVLLLVVAAVASTVPARRAARVDPQEALRYE